METKKIILQEPPQKRLITKSKKWCFNDTISSGESQLDIIKQLHLKEESVIKETIKKQIMDKINGYKAQDIKKSLFSPELFIEYSEVIELMIQQENLCCYCKNMVFVLYENSREPKQWSLERVDNSEGHNRKNVKIACLECNLRRGTMYHERFAFTKQLQISKKGET